MARVTLARTKVCFWQRCLLSAALKKSSAAARQVRAFRLQTRAAEWEYLMPRAGSGGSQVVGHAVYRDRTANGYALVWAA